MKKTISQTAHFLAIGQLSFLLGLMGLVLNYLFLGNHLLPVICSVILFGLSIVMNIMYLKQKRPKC